MKSKAKNSKLPRKSSNGTSQKQNNPGMDNAMKAIQSTLQDESQSGTGARAKHQSLNSKSNKALHYNCQNRRETLSPTPNPTSNGHEYPRFDPKPLITSMETEYIEALYSDLSGRNLHDSVYNGHSDFDLPPHSSSESDDIGYEDMESYEGDQGEEGDCKDFDDDLDVYKHDDFLSSQEAILMELRREQVEFEENVRQLQQQLQRQGSLHPLTSNDGGECKDISQGDVYSNKIGTTGKNNNDLENDARSVKVDDSIATKIHAGSMRPCSFCIDPKSSLCLEKYGSFWRPVIIEAMATAAAAIANFNARQYNESQGKDSVAFQYNEFLPKAKQSLAYPIIDLEQQDLHHLSQCSKAIDGDSVLLNSQMGKGHLKSHRLSQATSTRHLYRDTTPLPSAIRYPLPQNSPYKFRRMTSEFLEPVGEFHEFQSAEGNSRQVLLHVWPPSDLDAPLLEKLEACCRDFQENDVVRGHSGDGFLNGWRPSWKEPHQTGVLRFGHWRVRAPSSQGMRLYPPFQTPLTLAAGGGSVLWSNLNMNRSESSDHIPSPNFVSNRSSTGRCLQQQAEQQSQLAQQQEAHQPCQIHEVAFDASKESRDMLERSASSGANSFEYCPSCMNERGKDHREQVQGGGDVQLKNNSTQGRLLRLIRAIQVVEKVIIGRHLKYLFPTLYEKYHGLQFGTPRLFDAVATVALAIDVSPQIHRDKAHTKHGFCWIVACGDFVGGELCIPELGKRVVMRPGTVVAIRSTVVGYYVEKYAKNSSMYTMYGYTSDNNWPPAG